MATKSLKIITVLSMEEKDDEGTLAVALSEVPLK